VLFPSPERGAKIHKGISFRPSKKLVRVARVDVGAGVRQPCSLDSTTPKNNSIISQIPPGARPRKPGAETPTPSPATICTAATAHPCRSKPLGSALPHLEQVEDLLGPGPTRNRGPTASPVGSALLEVAESETRQAEGAGKNTRADPSCVSGGPVSKCAENSRRTSQAPDRPLGTNIRQVDG